MNGEHHSVLQFYTLPTAVCDETKNLNETESETFFRYQIFSIPNPKLFSIPKIFDTEFKTFLIPIFLDAESETDFDNKSEVFSVPIDMKEIARVHEEEEEEDSDDGADAFDSDAEEAESEEYDSDDFTDESTDDEAD